MAPFTASAAAPDAKPVQVKSEARVATPLLATHADTDMGVKAEEEQQQQTDAAPSLISAVTQTGVNPNATPQLPSAQSMLEDGLIFMPQMPADLQAELASSASSSFNGIATFGIMQQQQLSSTFDGSPLLAGDFAADMLASPAFAVTDVVDDDNNGEVADAAVGSNAGAGSPIIDIAAFNAAAGVIHSHIVCQQQHARMHAICQSDKLKSSLSMFEHPERASVSPALGPLQALPPVEAV